MPARRYGLTSCAFERRYKTARGDEWVLACVQYPLLKPYASMRRPSFNFAENRAEHHVHMRVWYLAEATGVRVTLQCA